MQLLWLELMCNTKSASPELQSQSATHTNQAVCGAGVYRPAVMSSFRLATARRDFLRAAVFCLMMPLTTALSISWYASDISFSTGLSSSSDSSLPP